MRSSLNGAASTWFRLKLGCRALGSWHFLVFEFEEEDLPVSAALLLWCGMTDVRGRPWVLGTLASSSPHLIPSATLINFHGHNAAQMPAPKLSGTDKGFESWF
jgi:hypothetical protein